MKTYSGQFYPTYFAFPREATLLLTDQLISIGYHDEGGNPIRLDWKIKDVQADFLFNEQCTRFMHGTSQAEFRVKNKEAFENWICDRSTPYNVKVFFSYNPYDIEWNEKCKKQENDLKNVDRFLG